jgi:hypothetical protein
MGSYVELPLGIALIPCDSLIEDRLTGKKSLIGIIGAIRCAQFPCVHPSLTILVSLTSGHGDYPCTLELVSESRNETVFVGKGDLKFKNPNQVVDLVFFLRRIRFEYPDVYWLKFLIDDMPIMTRPISVGTLELPQKPDGQNPPPPPAQP